ncbi:MAG: ATP-dependent helicase, partial [Parachlamydiaceae bacterium]
LVKMVAADLLEHEGALPSLNATLHAISKAANKGIGPEEISGTGSTWHDGFAQEVYRRLQASFRAYNALDFDHLLKQTVELFQKFPEVLSRYQERYRYIMIDEYQDTNPVQFALASQLSARYNNLCVVGDDDQAIYGWRGAEVKNILEFQDAKVIKLEQNYRSTNAILKAANSVIRNNKSRHPKALWSQMGEGSPINVLVLNNEQEEAEAVAYLIGKLKETQGVRFKDVAILYRSNALSRGLEIALLKQRWFAGDHFASGIPFEIFGGTEFYERREVKDLLAYLRVVFNPKDEEALLRIINLPRRGIGEASLDEMTSIARKQKIPLIEVLKKAVQGEFSLKDKARNNLAQFLTILEEVRERAERGTGSEAMNHLLERIQFRKAIEEEVKSDKMREFKWETEEELVQTMKEFEEKEGGGTLQEFVTSMTLQMHSISQANASTNKDRVSLMTFHSAKGLEFEYCFLVGMEDHLIPHEKSLKETGIEEERRLMYVALTRAKKEIYATMAKMRRRMGQVAPSRPSRFLDEVPKELIKPLKL